MAETETHGYEATGITRFLRAFKYTWAGFRTALKEEEAFKQEFILFCILTPVAIALPVPWMGTALMIGSMLIALAIELLNTGIEAAIDRISKERHPLSKTAKDVGSAAVFIGLTNVVVIWLGVLLDYFLSVKG